MHLNVWIVVFAAHSNVEAPELQRFLKIRGVGHEIRKCNDGYYLSVVSEATRCLHGISINQSSDFPIRGKYVQPSIRAAAWL